MPLIRPWTPPAKTLVQYSAPCWKPGRVANSTAETVAKETTQLNNPNVMIMKTLSWSLKALNQAIRTDRLHANIPSPGSMEDKIMHEAFWLLIKKEHPNDKLDLMCTRVYTAWRRDQRMICCNTCEECYHDGMMDAWKYCNMHRRHRQWWNIPSAGSLHILANMQS